MRKKFNFEKYSVLKKKLYLEKKNPFLQCGPSVAKISDFLEIILHNQNLSNV